MRILFMGTPEIAATCLERLLSDGRDVIGVYTKIDKPVGRNKVLTESPVKVLAKQHDLPVYQPVTFRDGACDEEIRSLNPDIIVAVAYGKILPQSVLDIPGYGCINIHGSLLPALRGSAPVQWSILNHCEYAGATAMYMNAGMDTGDIIEERSLKIEPYETSGELMERIAVLGAELLTDTLTAIENGTAKRIPQDESLATYAPMLTKELSPIDWNGKCFEIIDLVRGLQPWPVATCVLDGKLLKIFRVEKSESTVAAAPGSPLELTKQGLKIACGDGCLLITEVQAEGGKRMKAADYFRGHPIKTLL